MLEWWRKITGKEVEEALKANKEAVEKVNGHINGFDVLNKAVEGIARKDDD